MWIVGDDIDGLHVEVELVGEISFTSKRACALQLNTTRIGITLCTIARSKLI